MKYWFIAFAAIALIALMALTTKLKKNNAAEGSDEKPSAKSPLSEREQAMFNRLADSLPSLIVLAQVSFGALLKAKQRKVRNTFDRKIADFVICSKAFEVLAVIELDDASHRNKKEKDESRDEVLANAGYHVLRYANVPDKEQLQKDFAALLTKRRNMANKW